MSEFSEYDQENPHIWLLFRATTLMLLRQGFRHYGAKTIMERIRWHTSVEQGERDFKINNNWASFYARKFMEHHPQRDRCLRPPAGCRPAGLRYCIQGNLGMPSLQ